MLDIKGSRELEASAFPPCCQHSQQVTPESPLNQNRSFAPAELSSTAAAPSEHLLVFKAKAGCRSSFERLYAMYRQRVFRTIVSITMNREDAEDALQQTFLQAFQALHRFEFRSSFYSWITRIAINSSLVILRRRRNQSQIACTRWSDVEDGTWIENVPDAAPNPEQVYERAQQAQRLSVALKKLRPNERLIMELHLAEDLSIHDLAESLHISESAAKVRLYRARKKVVSDFKSQPTGRSRSSPISAR